MLDFHIKIQNAAKIAKHDFQRKWTVLKKKDSFAFRRWGRGVSLIRKNAC